MSDDPREQSRDTSASADDSRTDQYPTPSYAAHGPAGSSGPAASAQGGARPDPNVGAQQQGGNPYPPPGGHFPPQGGAYPPPNGPYPGPPTLVGGGPPRKRRSGAGIVVAALLAGLVGAGAGFGGAYALLDGHGPATILDSSPSSSAAVNAPPGSVEAAAQKATPSTVDIRVAVPQGAAEGSGVILTPDGDVLTNNHVVAGGNGQISVTLADGSEHPATVVGTSPSYDLAVVKMQGVSGLTPAALGQSGDVQVGQQVVAIGSPQGLTGTVTSGIVSALNRTVQVQAEDGTNIVYNGLQTDAPINHGNSGGPLVNLDGQVIGINSVINTGGSENGGSIGLGFAIPVDQARRVAQEIMDNGAATKPVLGVQGNTNASTQDGAPIAAVTPGSPAEQAGLHVGDVVTKVGDARVENFSDLVAQIGSYAPGQQVNLTITSGGAQRTVNVTLGSQPDKSATTTSGGQGRSLNPFGQGNPFGNPFGGGN